MEPRYGDSIVVLTRTNMEAHMMKGGLLWLIGIPLPIILILFFLGCCTERMSRP